MCEICEWGARQDPKLIAVAHEVEDIGINWPWTERNELEEWTPEDGYEDE